MPDDPGERAPTAGYELTAKEAAARLGLHGVYGVALDKALGFAIGFHMGGFLAVTLPGLYFASRLGVSLREVEARESRQVELAGAEGAPPGAAP